MENAIKLSVICYKCESELEVQLSFNEDESDEVKIEVKHCSVCAEKEKAALKKAREEGFKLGYGKEVPSPPPPPPNEMLKEGDTESRVMEC